MSLDLASDALKTIAGSSCVCADSRNLENLINSKDPSLRLQGFQGERFVRAPVTLQFRFSFPANIHKVVFYPAIGQQCAEIIQLCTSSSYPVARDADDLSDDLAPNDSRFRTSGSISLSKCARVAFLNRGYPPHPHLPTNNDDTTTVTSFTFGNLSNITALRIVIRKMLTGSVPSLSDLHIWGRPAKSCSQATKNEIFRLNRKSRQSHHHCVASHMLYSSNLMAEVVHGHDEIGTVSQSYSQEQLNENTCETIPEDLLDPITLEIMRFPVLLPSGHTVDRSTLDKHVECQSEFGNAASDPFTGILFTGSNKPFPNVKLKARIDEYRLGKSSKQAHVAAAPCNGENSYNGPSHSLQGILSLPESSTPAVVDGPQLLHKIDTNKRGYPTEHEGSLASSLDTCLAEIGHSMKKRRTVASTNDEATSALFCCKCSAYLLSSSTRYILPCNRTICGNCAKGSGMVIRCPCSSTHEFKSIRRTFQEC